MFLGYFKSQNNKLPQKKKVPGTRNAVGVKLHMFFGVLRLDNMDFLMFSTRIWGQPWVDYIEWMVTTPALTCPRVWLSVRNMQRWLSLSSICSSLTEFN